jgi:hypothetical protein
VKALSLQVSGAFPTWLHGDYIRNGPGTFKGMDHLFDGFGMLVKFSFQNGKVTIQQRCATPPSPKKPDCSACQAEDVICHLFCMPCLAETRMVKKVKVACSCTDGSDLFFSLKLWQAVFCTKSCADSCQTDQKAWNTVLSSCSVHELEDCSGQLLCRLTALQQHVLLRVASGSIDVYNCCRFVQSNAYKTFLDRGYKLKYNEFGTARPALQSLPVIAAGLLGIGQGES